MPLQARGDWVELVSVGNVGDTTSNKTFIYEVVTPGANVTEVAAGDLVIVDPVYTVQVGNARAYARVGEGILAKWNDVAGEPIVLYSSVYGVVDEVYSPSDEVVFNFSDARLLTVINLDPAITDFAANDQVLVARRHLISVGDRVEMFFIFRAEDVLAVNR